MEIILAVFLFICALALICVVADVVDSFLDGIVTFFHAVGTIFKNIKFPRL